MFLTRKRKQTHLVRKSFWNPHFKMKCCSNAWSSFSLPWQFSPSCAKRCLLQMCSYLAPHLAHALPGNECLKLCITPLQQGKGVCGIAYWRGAKHHLNNHLHDLKNICLVLLSWPLRFFAPVWGRATQPRNAFRLGAPKQVLRNCLGSALLRAQSWQENCWESGGTEVWATCASGFSSVWHWACLADGTLESDVIPKAKGGRAGGIHLGCGLWRLQAQAPGLLQLAERSGPVLWWCWYQLQAWWAGGQSMSFSGVLVFRLRLELRMWPHQVSGGRCRVCG